jgi:hypothetical protein
MSTRTADAVDLGAIDTTRWRIDPAGSSIKFRVKNFWGMATVEGRFTRYHGTLDLSARRAVALAVETASLDTGNEKRDAHLGGPEFFDADNHPYVRVVWARPYAKRGEATDRGGGTLRPPTSGIARCLPHQHASRAPPPTPAQPACRCVKRHGAATRYGCASRPTSGPRSRRHRPPWRR